MPRDEAGLRLSLVTVNGSLCSNYLAHIGLRGRSPAVVQARRRVVMSRVAPDSATNVSQIIRTMTARDLLAGDLGAHRALAVDPPEPPAPEPPPAVPPPAGVRPAGRGTGLGTPPRRPGRPFGIDDLSNEIDARAKELEQRTAAILQAETTATTRSKEPLTSHAVALVTDDHNRVRAQCRCTWRSPWITRTSSPALARRSPNGSPPTTSARPPPDPWQAPGHSHSHRRGDRPGPWFRGIQHRRRGNR